MSVEPGALDSNILVYAVEGGAPQHANSRALIESARDSATALYLTSQVLCEFYSVVTNPRRVAIPRSPVEAADAISALLSLPGIRVLPTPVRAVRGWMALLKRHPVTGGDVFDLQLVATMLAKDVRRIYTFNTADFQVFPELTVIAPPAVA
ncbi:MAG TPA: TA system VapC family ribonuclease toxin [Bryobacteraceae bacterium]|nr:TA system VapC family ribonuclease toxin [Bryobacteraceae bacterium]